METSKNKIMDNYKIKSRIQIQIEHYNYKTGNHWTFFIYNNVESKHNKKFGLKKWKVEPSLNFFKKTTYLRIECYFYKPIINIYTPKNLMTDSDIKEIVNKYYKKSENTK